METAFLSSLDESQRDALQLLRSRRNAPGLLHLGGHVAILILAAFMVSVARDSWFFGPAMLVYGIALVFLFAPLHECIHRTAFRTRVINDLLARIIGFVLVLPRDYFRCFHFAHHRHTQVPGLDPELAGRRPDSLGVYIWLASGVPYWLERIRTTLRHARARVDEPFIDAASRPGIVAEARLTLAVYTVAALVSVVGASNVLLIYWVWPVLLGQPILRLYLMAEHGGCPQSKEMLRNSRTTRTNSLLQFVAWNMPYHTAHHVCPAVPFHRLPAADALLREHIAVRAPGYLSVHARFIASFSADVRDNQTCL